MALAVERRSVVGGEHAADEVVEPAAPTWPRRLAAIGVGSHERLESLAGEGFDRVVRPIAGIREHDPERVGDAAACSPPWRR